MLVIGDPTLADAHAHKLIEERIPPDRRDLDVEIVRADEDGVDRAVHALRQVGMFASDRCAWLRGYAHDDGAEAERLLAFLQAGIPPGSTLIVSAAKIDQRSRLFRWFQANGDVARLSIATDKYGRPSEEALDAFIRQRIEHNGLPCPQPGVIEALRRRASGDLGELAQEIDKLCLACTPEDTIRKRDVELHVADRAEAWIFDLTNALSDRDGGRATALIEAMLDQGEPPLRLLAAVSRHVAELVEAGRFLAVVPPHALRNAGAFAREYFPKLPMEAKNRFKSGMRAYFLLRGAAAFDGWELRRLHAKLVEADVALKSTALSARHVLARVLQATSRSAAS